jgi:hypothetical protein
MITRHFQNTFRHVLFCEELFLKYSRRGKALYHLSKPLPLIPKLYSMLRQRVVVLRNYCQAVLLSAAEVCVEVEVILALS